VLKSRLIKQKRFNARQNCKNAIADKSMKYECKA